MYKIILERYNRWFEVETIIEHTGSIKEQMQLLFDGKNKLSDKEAICRKLVYDEAKVPTSATGKVIEEVRYRR